jgi:monoamine oxidase
VFFLASFGCDLQKLMGSQEGQAQHLRMPQGVGRIIDAIVKAVGAGNVYANSPVRDIVETEDGLHVMVKTADATVTARRVVVATTSAAANLIRFQPPLPPNRAQLQQRMGLGSVWKIWLAYDKPFWRPTLSGQVLCINPKSFVPNTRDSSLEDNGPGLLTCFVDGDKARELSTLTRDQRRSIILDEMEHAFGEKFPGAARSLSQTIKFPAVGPQNPEPDAYFEWNWSLPEFIRGDYAGTPGPGVYTASGFGPAIATPCGRVHWAGSDTATETYGNMSGAAESGDRAAAEVLEWEGKKQAAASAAK